MNGVRCLKLCGTSILVLASMSLALPKANEIQPQMGLGYNIGNTLEAPDGPTTWGNEFPTQELIDSVKSAGFNTVRIPCSWYSHTIDKDSSIVNPGWMDSVKTVVDYVIKRNMYAILNIHWDRGWLEDHIGSTVDATVNGRQESFWKQIATKFADYDEHLLFASANEPGMNSEKFNEARANVLKTYHQTMVNTVRSLGGNNATRTLIVQAPWTDENEAHKWLKGNFPTDPAGEGYMMGEFHFYPYQFSLMEKDADWGKCFYYWGDENYSTTDIAHNAIKGNYASPEYVDSVFAMLADDFKGIPMVIGEFGAIKRMFLKGENLRLHLQSVAAFYGKVATLSKKYGFIPCVWDTGYEGDGNMTIIRRNKNRGIMDYESMNAMRAAYGLKPLNGSTIDSLVAWSTDATDRAFVATYTSARSDSSETGTVRVTLGGVDWSAYTGLSFQMRLEGEAAPLDGESSGWTSVALFAMTGTAWDWADCNLGTVDTYSGKIHTVTVSLNGTGDLNLELADKSSVNAVGINVYATQFNGTMYLDNMLLIKADGSVDTLQNMNKDLPTTEGIATGKLQLVSADGTTGISKSRMGAHLGKALVNVNRGSVGVNFGASQNGVATVSLLNSLGRVIAQENIGVVKGVNRVQFATVFRGNALLVIKQGSAHYVQKVVIR